jgi:mediator of replication checkpoint protein 1
MGRAWGRMAALATTFSEVAIASRGRDFSKLQANLSSDILPATLSLSTTLPKLSLLLVPSIHHRHSIDYPPSDTSQSAELDFPARASRLHASGATTLRDIKRAHITPYQHTSMTIATMASTMPSIATGAPTKPRTKLIAALKPIEVSSDSSSAESEDEVVEVDHNAPTSRHQRSVSPVRDDDQEDSDGGGAYERMKKRLAAAKEPRNASQALKQAPVITTVASSDEDDEVPVRAATRKPVVRKAKSPSPPASPTPSVRSRRSSPGLFVTPNASPTKGHSGTPAGSDNLSQSPHNADLQKRVQRIRAERLAKQKEEQARGDNPDEASKTVRPRARENSGSDTDGENSRRLTQQAKPTRRAGKKAMEAMARDQQRISRNMQLTHQSKTKKRYNVKDLTSRWGLQSLNANKAVVESLPTADLSSALASSDAEAIQLEDTPPTSPPRPEEPQAKDVAQCNVIAPEATSDAQSAVSVKVDKGKGRAPEFAHLPPNFWTERAEQLKVQNTRVDVKKSANTMVELSDSDDDLQVIQPKSRFPVFDRVPLMKQQESSLLHLRTLAHLTSSTKSRKGHRGISLGEMQNSLAQKARQQAQQEREEKVAELKRRGIHIETEEEREKNQMEIEDIVTQFEKQRQEDLRLAKVERKEAKANGETLDGLPSSDDEDGDYVGSGEENVQEAEVDVEDEDDVGLEFSGSEDEPMEDVEASNDLIDEMATEDEDGETATHEQQLDEDADMDDEEPTAPVRTRTTHRSRHRVVDEDESEGETQRDPSPTQQATQDDAMAAFGFGNAQIGVGLTQMFAGTMANMESESQPTSAMYTEPEQDSLDFLRSLPETQPAANFSQVSDFVVPNSQCLISPQKQFQTGMESQFSLGISQLVGNSPAFSRTQLEDLPEPTQDAGFSFSRSPAGIMPPPSTVDTVIMSVAESPIKLMKGKLQRGRREAAVELSDVDEDIVEAELEAQSSEEDDIQRPPKPSRNAFARMQKAAQKQRAIEEFNKKTSLAKTAVMEQAEESEDEYAGLGGGSDDDSGEEDEATKNMIEHGEVEVDEREIAAFFA